MPYLHSVVTLFIVLFQFYRLFFSIYTNIAKQ